MHNEHLQADTQGPRGKTTTQGSNLAKKKKNPQPQRAENLGHFSLRAFHKYTCTMTTPLFVHGSHMTPTARALTKAGEFVSSSSNQTLPASLNQVRRHRCTCRADTKGVIGAIPSHMVNERRACLRNCRFCKPRNTMHS